MSKPKILLYLNNFTHHKFYFNTFNPLLSQQITSVKYLLIACSIINVIILIASIIFSDKAIKHLGDKQGWIRIASKILPIIILFVILFHIYPQLRHLVYCRKLF